MPRVTPEVVEHVARLARLALAADERERLRLQLDRILEHIQHLNELETEAVEPTFHVVPAHKNVFREDEPRPALDRELALQNAPDRQDGFFRVPRIIEDDGEAPGGGPGDQDVGA